MAYAEHWAVDTYGDNNSSSIMQPFILLGFTHLVTSSFFFFFSIFQLFIHCVTFFFKISSTMQYFPMCEFCYQMDGNLWKHCIMVENLWTNLDDKLGAYSFVMLCNPQSILRDCNFLECYSEKCSQAFQENVAPILFLLWELGSNCFSLFGKLTSKVGPSCTRMDVSLGEVYTCSLGKSQPQFQGKVAQPTQNLRNGQFCPRMIVIMGLL